MKKSPAAAAEALVELLSRENHALKAMNLPAAAALLDAKQAALAALAEAAEAGAAASLSGLSQRLHVLATENQGLLERAISVQARVIQIVASAYKPVSDMQRYGPNGVQTVFRAPAVALSTRC
jgi:outer membrane receptor protein involved in Fe transport